MIADALDLPAGRSYIALSRLRRPGGAWAEGGFRGCLGMIMLDVPGTEQTVVFEDWILGLVDRFGEAEMTRI